MPLTKLRLSALALALGSVTAAQAQSFDGVVTIGDSLSDSGNIAALFHLFFPAGNAFTTNPDPVYAEIVAASFGYTQSNYSPYIAGSIGTDWAVGGACVRPNSAIFSCVNDVSGGGVFSLTNQLNSYLADPARNGHADPHTLYIMWGGGNDIASVASNPATVEQNIAISANDMIGLIGTLQNAGAHTIVVLNQYDGGLTPGGLGSVNPAYASHLGVVYNNDLNAGLATLGDGIVPINVYGLFHEFVANPGLYGFTNVTDGACGPNSLSVACGAPGSGNIYTYPAGANETYLWADPSHPSGAAHARLASVVLATLSAPGQVSMAGELPLQMYDDHSNVINNRIFGIGNNARASDETGLYEHVQSSHQQFAASANTNAMDNHQFTATVGADRHYGDTFRLGAAISFGNSNGDSRGASVNGEEVLLSAYGVAHFGSGYLNAIVSGGRNNLDIDRRIVLGPTTRIEHGSPHATHQAFELGGGFAFGSDDFQHGPFASVTWQKIAVHAYAEDSLDSTAMTFNGFDRKSLVGRLGYQLQGSNGRWQPFGRVAYARENHNDATAVQAGSRTMNGHFTLDGFQAARDWFEADVGADYALSDKTTLSVSYRARLSDSAQDLNSLDFGLRTEF
jgi:outer membrane lipase/esterase